MTTITERPNAAAQQRDALGERLFGSLRNGPELLTVGLGVQTGLYAALWDGELATAGQPAERCAQEWLEHDAAHRQRLLALPPARDVR